MEDFCLLKRYFIHTTRHKMDLYYYVKNKIINLLSIQILSITFLLLLPRCKDNIVSPKQESADTTWLYCAGLPSNYIIHFAASGNNLVAGAYATFLSQAYIYLSFENGNTWELDTTFQVNNHNPANHLYIGLPVVFLSHNNYLFAGISAHTVQSNSNGVLRDEKY